MIVFDFWASWCGNCLEAFPKMRKLQDSLAAGLQIILVNQKGSHDSHATIERVFESHKSQISELPKIVQDTILHELFSTFALPSYAVITSDTDLSGIASGFLFSEEGVKALVGYREKLLEVRKKFKARKGGKTK